jgi:hypothetical protein
VKNVRYYFDRLVVIEGILRFRTPHTKATLKPTQAMCTLVGYLWNNPNGIGVSVVSQQREDADALSVDVGCPIHGHLLFGQAFGGKIGGGFGCVFEILHHSFTHGLEQATPMRQFPWYWPGGRGGNPRPSVHVRQR